MLPFIELDGELTEFCEVPRINGRDFKSLCFAHDITPSTS